MLQLLSRSRYAVQLEDLQNPNVVRELQGSEVAGKGGFTFTASLSGSRRGSSLSGVCSLSPATDELFIFPGLDHSTGRIRRILLQRRVQFPFERPYERDQSRDRPNPGAPGQPW